MWLKHPRTEKPDTMLSLAVAGFILAGILTVAGFVAAWLTGNSTFVQHLAAIDAAILTPTVAAYTARKYSDMKLNGKEKK